MLENRMRGDVLFGLRGRKHMETEDKLHNGHLHSLSFLLSIIRIIKSRRMRWEGHVARIEETRYAYRILVGKTQRKRLLERHKQKWYDIKKGSLPFKCRVKSHLPFPDIIRSSPYSPC
jgi:hypothetical protein